MYSKSHNVSTDFLKHEYESFLFYSFGFYLQYLVLGLLKEQFVILGNMLTELGERTQK